MAEQKKEAGGKEKKSFLDDGIGDDFLGSWKTMSVDDSMDFNIETVPKGGKKKKFNFGNLDMDFNLDGDFGKLPSFKMDMPDLDFSSPDNASKPKDKGDRGSSSAPKKGKLDAFDMSFDFDGFDRFNLDGDILKGDDKAPATKDTDKHGAGMTGCERHDPKILIAGVADGSESSHTEDSTASEKIINQADKTAVAPKGTDNALRGDDSKVETYVEHAAESSSEEIVGVRTEGTNEQGSSSDIYTPRDQCIPSPDEGINKNQCAEHALQSTASQSLGGSDSIQDAQSDVAPEADCLDSRVTVKSDAEHPLIGLRSMDENQKQLSKSNHLNTNGQEGKKGVNREIFPESTAEGTKETEPVATGTDSEDNQKSSSTDLPTEDEPVTDNDAITKAEGTRLVQSKFFRKSGDVRPPLASSSLRISSFGSSELASKQLNHLGSGKLDVQTGKNLGGQLRLLSSDLRKSAPPPALLKPDVQTGRNSGGYLKPLPTELRKSATPALLFGRKNVKNTATSSSCKDDAIHDANVPTDTPIPPDKVVAKGAPVILRSVSNSKDPDNTSGEGNASSSVDKMPKFNIPKSMKSSLPAMRSVPSSRVVPLKALKSENQMLPNLSSFKVPRNMEVNRDQQNVPNKTLKGLSKITEAQQNAASLKITHPVTHEQRKKSLKRDTEAFNSDLAPLNPRKRLSPSWDKMRMSDEQTEGIAGDQVYSTDSEVGKESGSMPHGQPISGFPGPQEVNLEEPKIDRIQMASEYGRKIDEVYNTDSEVGKEAGSMPLDQPIYAFPVPQEVNLEEPKIDRIRMASEYGRKIDELCNMMKKMNEQAKELMVRSVVNNNKLLLLNHREVDEKIRIAMRYAGKSGGE
ncbi:unnamed protein product [Linum trigynum]|uniref:Uncharacterized protein n=1 Tax=Linum trigynum TaxID=586398 RepID=A0AAV2GKV1_9ROSI